MVHEFCGGRIRAWRLGVVGRDDGRGLFGCAQGRMPVAASASQSGRRNPKSSAGLVGNVDERTRFAQRKTRILG
jgi:hypothetical protein